MKKSLRDGQPSQLNSPIMEMFWDDIKVSGDVHRDLYWKLQVVVWDVGAHIHFRTLVGVEHEITLFS